MIDSAAVRAYCEIVFADPPRGGMIALRGFSEPKKDNNPPHTPWIDPFTPGWIDSIVSFVQTCDGKRLAAYCIPGFVQGRRASAADVLTLPTLLVDFDAGEIAAKATKAIDLLGAPSLCVHSGGTLNGQPKIHLYWRLTGDVTAKRVARLRGLAARFAGADAMFEEGREHQPIRIAGSVHRKGEAVQVTIAYRSESSLDVREVEALLSRTSATTQYNEGPPLDDSTERNTLGLSRKVSLDELITRRIGHGETDINRFEAMTRMIGMFLANIHDINDADECEREFGYLRQWARSHIQNVERDYDLRQHWRRLLQRERWKRSQPRMARARPRYRSRGR